MQLPLEHVFDVTKLIPVQVPDPVAPAKRPVPPVMVKVAVSAYMLGSELQVSVPVEEVVRESPLGVTKVTTPVKDLTQVPAPVGPAPLPANSPKCLRYPLRLTVQKLLELKVQVKCPKKTPVKVIEDRADAGVAEDRENRVRRTTGIKNRTLGATLNFNSAQSPQSFVA